MSANEVENVSAAMANVNISDSAAADLTTEQAKPNGAADGEAVLASAAEGRRLYIGNLAYATTEGELKEFFKDFPV